MPRWCKIWSLIFLKTHIVIWLVWNCKPQIVFKIHNSSIYIYILHILCAMQWPNLAKRHQHASAWKFPRQNLGKTTVMAADAGTWETRHWASWFRCQDTWSDATHGSRKFHEISPSTMGIWCGYHQWDIWSLPPCHQLTKPWRWCLPILQWLASGNLIWKWHYKPYK